jgi:long-chain acyl-CoA synthetase
MLIQKISVYEISKYVGIKLGVISDFLEGYGMTETSAGSCTTFPGDPLSGHVGGPVANVKIRLRDIPEMNYLST